MTSSLRKQIKKEIKERCPELLKKEKGILDYVADKKWALFIFVFYFLFFLISIVVPSPDCLKYITISNPQELNNSSNGVLASIVGITMVIIGFIFTEIKSKSFVNFQFFSERTFIFPIFYSSLANIASMLLISLLCDTTEIRIGNAVILGHYLIIFVNIPLIIFIFIRVSKFMDYKPVFESYRIMLLKKATSILLQEKIVAMFNDRISYILSENNITVQHSLNAIYNHQKPILNSRNSTGMLYDVNIKRLRNAITSIVNLYPKEPLQYSRFLIGKNIATNTTLLYANEVAEINLMTIEVFKTKEVERENNETIYKGYLDNIHNQYLDAVRNNNVSQVTDYLSIYRDLNYLYMLTNEKLQ